MKRLLFVCLMAIVIIVSAVQRVNAESVKERLKRAQVEEESIVSDDNNEHAEEKQEKWLAGYDDLANCREQTKLHEDEIKALEGAIYALEVQKKEKLADLGYKRSNLNEYSGSIQKLTSDHLASNADAQSKNVVSNEAQKKISEFNSQISDIEVQLTATKQEYDDKILSAKNKYNDLMTTLCPNIKLPTYD